MVEPPPLGTWGCQGAFEYICSVVSTCARPSILSRRVWKSYRKWLMPKPQLQPFLLTLGLPGTSGDCRFPGPQGLDRKFYSTHTGMFLDLCSICLPWEERCSLRTALGVWHCRLPPAVGCRAPAQGPAGSLMQPGPLVPVKCAPCCAPVCQAAARSSSSLQCCRPRPAGEAQHRTAQESAS